MVPPQGPNIREPCTAWATIETLSPAGSARMLRAMRFSAEEARVIGSLIEKQLTTPDQYPLTLKALVAACNQASNRDPVVSYDEHTVMSTLNELKPQRFIRFVLPSHGRSAVRYRHILDETLALDRRQCALLAVLLLRGPQTVGELRIRTDRMVEFDGLSEIEHELTFMASVDEPLTRNIGRRPGQKEERWACPLVMSPTSANRASDNIGPEDDEDDEDDEEAGHVAGLAAPDDLRSQVAVLRSEVAELRHQLQALKESLGE
jgi:uncharacterized protein YceH (UPF0502 family)